MSNYTPNCWLILEFPPRENTNDLPFYKVLAGWSGSYLDGTAWRLNSGIVDVHEDEMYYYFKGASGSVYNCFKGGDAVRMPIAGVLGRLLDAGVVIVDVEDFVKGVSEGSIKLLEEKGD